MAKPSLDIAVKASRTSRVGPSAHVFFFFFSYKTAKLESKERLVSDLNSKAPETIGLFRDKDAQLRQLMTQLNRKDVQLADYARQIDKLKRTRNQLASGT